MYSEIHPPTRTLEWIREWKPTGIILSGGPNSVYGDDAPTADPAHARRRAGARRLLRDAAHRAPVGRRGHGAAAGASTAAPSSRSTSRAALFDGFDARGDDDGVDEPRRSRRRAAAGLSSSRPRAAAVPIAALRHETKPIYGVQFHPEVAHTPRGGEIIANFLFEVCDAQPTLDAGRVHRGARWRRSARWSGRRAVICGLSGGVDSSVAAALVHRAIGDQLTCIFVDTGLLRLHEREQVERTFRAQHGHQAGDGRRVEIGSSTRSRASRIPRRSGRSSATRSSTCSRKRRRRPGTTRSSWCRERCIPT